MKTACGLLFLFSTAIVLTVSKECSEHLHIYNELKWEPVYLSTQDECPLYYKKHWNDKKCILGKKEYAIGENVPTEETTSACAASCFCDEKDGKPTFTCANIECPEMMGIKKPGCVYQYKLNQCCSHKSVCPPITGLAKCQVKSREYWEGEKYSVHGCKRCVCTKDANGKTDESHCSPLDCGIALRHAHHIRQNCAPVYHAMRDCCPYEWICETGHEVVKSKSDAKGESVQKCSFGKMKLNIGDRVIDSGSTNSSQITHDIICECRVPPIVTCMKGHNHDHHDHHHHFHHH